MKRYIGCSEDLRPWIGALRRAGQRYRTEPAQVFEEFVRRMSGLVFQAARHFVERANSPVNAIEVEKLHGKVFENFTPQFTSGAPSMILVDFAKAIRRVLDDQAFEAIARKYYCQLPITT